MYEKKPYPKLLEQAVFYHQRLFQVILCESQDPATGRFFKKVFEKKSISLEKIKKKIKVFNTEQKKQLVHSVACYLEYLNVLENAYRTSQLRKTFLKKGVFKQEIKKDLSLTFVLTAHPTEGRTDSALFILNQLQRLCVLGFEKDWESVRWFLEKWLRLLLKTPLARKRKPKVLDEAELIFETLFRKDIFETLLKIQTELPVWIRTWVGGDKDGHHGVDEVVLKESLEKGRSYLLGYLKNYFQSIETSIALSGMLLKEKKVFQKLIRSFYVSMKALEVLFKGDAKKVCVFFKKINLFFKKLRTFFPKPFPEEFFIQKIEKVFPALVVPVELRESIEQISTWVRGKEKKRTRKKIAILKMLENIKDFSQGGDPKGYARALVMSQVERAEQVALGIQFLEQVFPKWQLPLIPLFENKKALIQSIEILKPFLEKKRFRKNIQTFWKNHIEVMVGYSDSSKEGGLLSSRFLVERALWELEQFFKKEKIYGRYFHGAGGSVTRGGGSIEEQMHWWPKGAVERFKVTVQGEMIARLFSTREIFLRTVDKIVSEATLHQGKRSLFWDHDILKSFVEKAESFYQKEVCQNSFLNQVERITLYKFLKYLKLGSRPSKRKQKKTIDLKTIRAIPWVLCWSQVRFLFPAWWGVGSAWKSMSGEEKKRIKKCFKKDALFRSCVKWIAFSLAQSDQKTWEFFVKNSSLTEEEKTQLLIKTKKEWLHVKKFVFQVTGEKELLWFRFWLKKSLSFRNPWMQVLSVFQKDALENGDLEILRESVLGIASGLLVVG